MDEGIIDLTPLTALDLDPSSFNLASLQEGSYVPAR